MTWTSSEWFALGGSDEGAFDGSGTTPSISLASDYCLRDENNEAITDESGDPLSLEGL